MHHYTIYTRKSKREKTVKLNPKIKVHANNQQNKKKKQTEENKMQTMKLI